MKKLSKDDYDEKGSPQDLEQEKVNGNKGEKGIKVDLKSLSSLVQHKQIKQLVRWNGPVNLAKELGSDAYKGFPEGFNYQEQKKKFGSNYVPPPPPKTYLELIFANLQDTIILMLIAAAVVSLILGMAVEKDLKRGWIEGASILISVTVVINVQALTDYSKAKEFRRQQMELENQQVAHVVRAGQNEDISPRDIVAGDVLRFAVGDILAVDCVIIEGNDVKMDESAITGESKLINKSVFSKAMLDAARNDESKIPEKVDPFLVSGTNVMSGTGLALAVAVGENSVQGAILATIGKEEVVSSKPDKTKDVARAKSDSAVVNPLEGDNEVKVDNLDVPTGGTLVQKLDEFALLIGKVGGTIAVVAFLIMLIKFCVIEFLRDGDCKEFDTEDTCVQALNTVCAFKSGKCVRVWDSAHDLGELLEFLVTAITILVVVIPEGLPLAVTLSLAVSMRRMTKDNNQVKHLDACETMGSATTVCSDKTGTLTINKMTVVKCALGDGSREYAKQTGTPTSFGNEIKAAINGLEAEEQGSTLLALKLLCFNGMLNSAPTSNVTRETVEPGARGHGNTALEFKYAGNATECALLKLCMEFGYEPAEVRLSPLFNMEATGNDWGAFKVPFSSERKMMSTVIARDGLEYLSFTKGAPNYVLQRCTKVFDVEARRDVGEDLGFIEQINDFPVRDLNDDIRQLIDTKIGEFQRYGLRVIALACRVLPSLPDAAPEDAAKYVEDDLTLIGVVGIEDPLRPEIIDAIAKCNRAGVDIRMCTGDALETAVSIALQSGILRQDQVEDKVVGGVKIRAPKENFAMTGPEFVERVLRVDKSKPKVLRKKYDFDLEDVHETMAYPFMTDATGDLVIDQEKMDEIWPKLRVLARCQPIDKLTLVKGLKRSNVFQDVGRCKQLKEEFNIEIFPDRQVVAVTGDGTNDAPALKKADVGFAMNITGTETAKQAADILLLDDNFLSIVKAIMWGRNVYQAISKFMQFQLTVNISAVFLAVFGAIYDNESPLRPVQMLWVNLIMDSLASLALATDPPDERLLDRKPYGRRRRILSEVMLFNIIGQAFFQVVVLLWIFFYPDAIPKAGSVISNDDFIGTPEDADGFGSVHWTVFFNVFVLMQIFNEINSRKIQDVRRLRTQLQEWNVFEGFFSNHIFLTIFVSTLAVQILIVQFAGAGFTIAEGGLTLEQWLFCIGLGALSLVWQVIAVNPMLAIFGRLEDDIFQSEEAYEEETTKSQHRAEKRWEKLKKHVHFGGGPFQTVLAGDLEATIDPDPRPIKRGSNRPGYGYTLTKQDSQKLERVVTASARGSRILQESSESN